MTYHSIPVSGADDINQANASLLQSTIAEIGDEPVLIHCGIGNRVGALVALNTYKTNSGDLNDSIDEGKRWGLTRLEPKVRSILANTEVSK